MRAKQKQILITLGDPLGIGTEVTCKALSTLQNVDAQFYVFGTKAHLNLPATLLEILHNQNVQFIEVPFVQTGDKKRDAGSAAMNCIHAALAKLTDPKTQALVTAPVCKTHLQMAGSPFWGHTEWLCAYFHVDDYAMMLFGETLRVVLMSIHKPLRAIFADITEENLNKKLRLTLKSLQHQFSIPHPKIAVCGLNPHASEDGLFGDEENTILKPAIEKFTLQYGHECSVFGPQSSDTVFHHAAKKKFDAVICHYHDQGLIPLKTMHFDSAVNMTLGLPFIRTSPDHGTAFDIAGKMVASETSMRNAMHAALQFLQGSL